MPTIEKIQIREFRGIRNLDLNIGGKTFVIYGPNGSGKSGVVDAIEFVLRGTVSRLSGEGTGQLTLDQHGPHALSQGNPERSLVQITISDNSLSNDIEVERRVTLNSCVIQPNTTAAQAIFSALADSSEFTLSRSAILKYVVSAPGTRAQRIQALLRLDQIERLRGNLKSALNIATRVLRESKSRRKTEEADLSTHLGVVTRSNDEILRLINQKRTELGAPPIETLGKSTNFLEDVVQVGPITSINAGTARHDVGELTNLVANLDEIGKQRVSATTTLEALTGQPELVRALRHQSLLETGMSLVNSNFCPLCGTDWGDAEELVEHIKEDLLLAEEARPIRDAIGVSTNIFIESVRSLRNSASLVIPVAREYGSPTLPVSIEEWLRQLDEVVSLTQDLDGLLATPDRMNSRSITPTDELRAQLSDLTSTIANLPTQSPTQSAWTYLTVARERWGRVASARIAVDSADMELATVKVLYQDFCDSSDNELNPLYDNVQDDFVHFYRFLNSDDEATFTAQFTPREGSLDLQVDFYGIGKFPPNAFHSEGHQDGMGLCLYLALMKKLNGERFTLCVLDDVVMSVDTGHRRRLVDLFRNEFPDVQFIITTHDEVWARQLLASNLTSAGHHARFHGWTVQDGPLIEQRDVWNALDAEMARGDAASAAHRLRRWLESASADIADSLGGMVPYHSDGRYELGEFLDAIKGRYKRLLSEARTAASAWNNSEEVAKIALLDAARRTAISEENEDHWVLNALVHNNDVNNLTVDDLRPLVTATHTFLNLFQCTNPDCSSWIYVDGIAETSLRCQCGSYSLNLTTPR